MSSNASVDGSQSAHSDMEDILAVRNESMSSNKPANRPHRATTLSECLEAVRDCLLDSPDRKLDVAEVPSLNDPFAILFAHDRKSDVVEDPSPRDQLVFKYPCRSGVEDEVRYYVRHICSQSCLVFRSCSHPDWGIAVPKTSQASDVDSDRSCKSELGQTKSELNTLIDEISAVSLGID